MSTVETPVDPPTEDELRVSWRLAMLEQAGYEEREARLLAECLEIDLHLATDLLEKGCPPDTALRILL